MKMKKKLQSLQTKLIWKNRARDSAFIISYVESRLRLIIVVKLASSIQIVFYSYQVKFIT